MTKYAFQRRAVFKVMNKWRHGARSVLLVAPTGAGKTVMGAELAKSRKTLWVAHRQELVFQARDKLQSLVGKNNVGIIMADEPANPEAQIQVGTIETLISRMAFPKADLVVLDEAHHYLAESWKYLATKYARRGTRVLGLTATPERRDGTPLGDIFEQMVIAAHYSELIERGVLVQPVIFGPDKHLKKHYAADPIKTWWALANGLKTFMFASHVEKARSLADAMSKRRVPSRCIDFETDKHDRAVWMQAFRDDELTVLTNAFCLTEGVDVPDATAGVGLRSFDYVGTYLQAFGRLLRAAKGKNHAILIDLCGAYHVHGSPAADRDYSLEGRPIQLCENPPVPPRGKQDPGVCVDLDLFTLDAGPIPEKRLPLPRLPEHKVDLTRARRMRRHGLGAVRDVIERTHRMN